MDLTLTNLSLALIAGITSIASPCVLPIIPIIVTGTKDDHKYRPLLIVLGLSFTFILMGLITVLFSELIAGKFMYLEKVVGSIIICFGFLMLLDRNVFKSLTLFSQLQIKSGGRWSGFVLGLSLGIIWIPCIGPVLSGVLAMVAVQGKLLSSVILLAFYSLGFAIPMLVAGYSSQLFRQKITIIQKYPLLIRFISGGILIVFGVYIFNQGIIGFYF